MLEVRLADGLDLGLLDDDGRAAAARLRARRPAGPRRRRPRARSRGAGRLLADHVARELTG